MKKRILVCAYFARNIGDDLFLKILFDRYSNIQWDLLTANRNYKKIFSDYENVNIVYTYRSINLGKHSFNLFFKLNDFLLHYRKYDAMVNIGGSIFMQGSAWKMKLNEREYLVNQFKKMNKKAFIIGANFGPYKDNEFLNENKELFTKYDDICFRESFSYNIFKDFNNVRLAPDVVFNLAIKKHENREKSVGFSIIDLEKRDGLKEFYHKYNDKMIQLVKEYIDLGYKTKLFSFCDNEGDLNVISQIVSQLNDNYKSRIDVINYEGNINRFLNEFNSCELIVGTRFHSIILALISKQNVFPIIYSDKTYNVLKDLRLEENSCYIKDIQNLNAENVLAVASNNRIEGKKVFYEAKNQFEKLDLFIR
ncbi:MAG: polysaccharide pyruvyl transferase family protein [Bacillus sp. (in: Bacteria)]|nr:polysaccharide pyruvyl transferase family protein [Bacillus sp. (in: firmicutes)]